MLEGSQCQCPVPAAEVHKPGPGDADKNTWCTRLGRAFKSTGFMVSFSRGLAFGASFSVFSSGPARPRPESGWPFAEMSLFCGQSKDHIEFMGARTVGPSMSPPLDL